MERDFAIAPEQEPSLDVSVHEPDPPAMASPGIFLAFPGRTRRLASGNLRFHGDASITSGGANCESESILQAESVQAAEPQCLH
jgi:hypothetical protein